MQGHAAANMVPLVASNRIGKEDGEAAQMTFFGASFIADHFGAKDRAKIHLAVDPSRNNAIPCQSR